MKLDKGRKILKRKRVREKEREGELKKVMLCCCVIENNATRRVRKRIDEQSQSQGGLQMNDERRQLFLVRK